MTYMFGATLSDEVLAVHGRCVEIQHRVAAQLRPGAVPARIYASIMEDLTPDFLQHFMGFGFAPGALPRSRHRSAHR